MSELLKEIRTLSAHQVSYVLVLLAAIISPGLLILYHYQYDLFISLSNIKLILLSSSMSIPIVISSTLLAVYDTEEQSYEKVSFFGFFITVIVSIPALFICYVFGFSFKGYVICMGGTYFGLLGLMFLDKQKRERQKIRPNT